MDDELKTMTDKVEYMFLKKLTTGLRDGSMKTDVAREYAQSFLKLEPFTSFEDVKAKMDAFVQIYPLFLELKEYVEAYHYEQKVDTVIKKMQQYMSEDKIDEAIQVAHAE
jgi:DNA-binding SARP family transcriptional activator